MPTQKPLPLMVGNKAYYSLTSYDPVEVVVEIPRVTDEDLALATQMTVAHLGGTMADLDDPAWVSEHFGGLTSRAQVDEAIRQQVEYVNEQMAEDVKLDRCIEKLRERLVQAVPAQHLEEARQAVRLRFEQSMADEGMTTRQFIARAGITLEQLEAMFSQQALEMAEGDAVLSAYAHEKRLKVDDSEIGSLLGLPPEQARETIGQAFATGHADDLREVALRAKAAQMIVSECSCTYVHESLEQAQVRAAQYQQMQQRFGNDPDDDGRPQGRTGFKLV